MKITKAKIFLILSLFFIAGIGARSLFRMPMIYTYATSLLGITLLVLFWKSKKLRVIGFGLIILILGISRYEFSIPKVNESVIQFYNNQEARFIGVVSQEPDTRKDHVKLTIEVYESKRLDMAQNEEKVKGQKGGQDEDKISGKVLVNTYLYPEYDYGDKLEVSCKLQAPEKIDDFYYDRYLARYDIYSVCYYPKIKLLEKSKGNFLMANLLKIKSRFISVVQRSLSEPQASFLGGLILGAKKSIPDNLMQAFNRTGTTHIVALSGYNITIIAVLIMNICKNLWISRRRSFWISVAGISFFILITGVPSSAVRAGVMGILVLLATQLGRMSRITNVLILAALAMLLNNPKVLVFDAGFQLSFLATIGLVYLSPKLEKYFKKWPNPFGLKENLVATLSAIILTTPLILYQFGRLSVVAPLVNVLILPTIPIAMSVGFVVGITGLIWLPLGQIVGWMAWVILSYIIFVVEGFSKISWVSIQIGKIHWIWLVVFYLVIGVFIINPISLFHKRKVAA